MCILASPGNGTEYVLTDGCRTNSAPFGTGGRGPAGAATLFASFLSPTPSTAPAAPAAFPPLRCAARRLRSSLTDAIPSTADSHVAK
eukprot:103540-Chlamydomonas_euryale.AAC.1